MDGAHEVERKRAAQAVSAKVDTGARGCVSFGEPQKTRLLARRANSRGAIVGRKSEFGLWRSDLTATKE
jgi:hypothetical protein